MNKFFRIPFGFSGDKTAVPDASQPSGSVSYTDGFTPDYAADPATVGTAKNVPREGTNQLLYDATLAIQELQAFGTPDFITSALNGGSAYSYAKGARVRYTDGEVYTSLVANNTALPTVSANWRKQTDALNFLAVGATAFESSVANGAAVYWDAANNRYDEAIADGTTKQNVVGFADITNQRVIVSGLYSGQLSGMTGNTTMYLSPTVPGGITATAPSRGVIVGVAKSATELFVGLRSISGSGKEPGEVFTFAGTSAPAGSLICPISPQNISRTTYAALFAAIGTTWGAGDGSTTFGMPWYATGHAIIQANGNVGAQTVGQNLRHNHGIGSSNLVPAGSNTAGVANNSGVFSQDSGGDYNLPAGSYTLICVRYLA